MCTIFQLVSDEEALKGKTIIMDYLEDSFDGVFESVEDYIKFVKQVDDYGIYGYLDFIGVTEETPYELDGCKVYVTNRNEGRVKLVFDEPITTIINFGGNIIPQQLKTLEGVLSYEWYTLNTPERRQDKYANGIEITFTIDIN